jgi:hypothetical protein
MDDETIAEESLEDAFGRLPWVRFQLFARNKSRRGNSARRLNAGRRSGLVVAVEDVHNCTADHTGKRIRVNVRWEREIADVLVILHEVNFFHEK